VVVLQPQLTSGNQSPVAYFATSYSFQPYLIFT
jgi:hypothetical protein